MCVSVCVSVSVCVCVSVCLSVCVHIYVSVSVNHLSLTIYNLPFIIYHYAHIFPFLPISSHFRGHCPVLRSLALRDWCSYCGAHLRYFRKNILERFTTRFEDILNLEFLIDLFFSYIFLFLFVYVLFCFFYYLFFFVMFLSLFSFLFNYFSPSFILYLPPTFSILFFNYPARLLHSYTAAIQKNTLTIFVSFNLFLPLTIPFHFLLSLHNHHNSFTSSISLPFYPFFYIPPLLYILLSPHM